jgi:vaccinia related kinase
MEILAYNLIEWCGTILPWVSENLLANPAKVQHSKESHMKDPSKFLAACFKSTPIPPPIKEFLQYVTTLKFDQQPDYKKCSGMFEKALKTLGKPNSGALEFGEVAAKSKATTSKATKGRIQSPAAARQSPRTKRGTSDQDESPELVPTAKRSRKNDSNKKVPELEPSDSNGGGDSNNIVVNNEIKTKKKSKKVYEFNFELDVSIDADVIVNVKRKKKSGAADEKAETEKKTKAKKESPVKVEDDNGQDQSGSEDEGIVPETSPPPVIVASRNRKVPAVKIVKKASPPAKVNRIMPASLGRAGEYKGKKAKKV